MRHLNQIGSIFLFLGLILMCVQPISAEEEVNLELIRTFGTGLGSKIQGNFTIKGTGTIGIVSLSLTFNQTQVANVSSNSLTFRFNTEDYALGFWNISIIGFTALDERYTDSIIVEFIGDETGTIITVGVGAFVLAILTIRIIRAIKNKKLKEKSPKDIKKAIKIQIDKDFA